MGTETDDFNRANENPLGSPWEVCVGSGLQLVSNGVKSAAAGLNVSAMTGVTWDDDQTGTFEVTAIQGYDFAGGAVRMTNTGNGYIGIAEFGDGRFYCYRMDAGVATSLGFRAETFIATDTIGIGVVGSTITLYKNDIAVGSTFSDATHASGAAGGSYNFGDSNLTVLDNFVGTGAQTGPSLTAGNPTDGTEATVTTSGLTTYTGGTLGGKAITLSGTIPNLAYTFTTFGGTSSGTSPRIGEAVNLAVTGAEGTATTSVTPQPQAGTAAITLAGTLEKSAGQFLPAVDTALGVTTVVTNQILYATADSTSITAAGVLTSDATSIQMWLLQGGDADNAATSTPFVVTFGAGGEIIVNKLSAYKLKATKLVASKLTFDKL